MSTHSRHRESHSPLLGKCGLEGSFLSPLRRRLGLPASRGQGRGSTPLGLPEFSHLNSNSLQPRKDREPQRLRAGRLRPPPSAREGGRGGPAGRGRDVRRAAAAGGSRLRTAGVGRPGGAWAGREGRGRASRAALKGRSQGLFAAPQPGRPSAAPPHPGLAEGAPPWLGSGPLVPGGGSLTAAGFCRRLASRPQSTCWLGKFGHAGLGRKGERATVALTSCFAPSSCAWEIPSSTLVQVSHQKGWGCW